MAEITWEIDFEQVPSPCYLLDERLLLRNLKKIKAVRDASDAKVLLAFKGFAMHGIFDWLVDWIDGVSASSLHEVLLSEEKMGYKAHTYSPAYIPDEFDEILSKSSHITFNSLSQWTLYKDKTQAAGVSPGLRVNPLYSEIDTDLYNPGSPDSRLGITRDQMEVFPEGIEGLHIHCLCENNSYTLERLLTRLEDQFGEWLPHLKWLNLGGGHLITGKGYDIDHLISLLKGLQSRYPNLELILEPGAAFVWQTGYLAATVLDIVPKKGYDIAVLDVSFAAHMPDCLEMPYKPKIIGAIEPNELFHNYKMGGTTCLAGDQVGDYAFISPLSVGDKVVFHDMMHYTMVKTTTFNGVKHPSIGIWTAKDTYREITSFGYQTFKDRLS